MFSDRLIHVCGTGTLALVMSAATSWAQEPANTRVSIQPYELALSDGRQIPAELGNVRVPERRGAAKTDTISLAFIRLRSSSGRPGNPIVVLPGSPGGASGTQTLRAPQFFPFFERLRSQGDVIVLDYRGSGMSTPLLACPASTQFDANIFASEANAKQFFLQQAAQCRLAMQNAERDIGGYTWKEIADDLVNLQQALNVPTVDVVGFSSGTHAALAALRTHGNIIGRVVFLGTEGPDDTRKLPLAADRQVAAIAALIEADTVARAQYSDFAGMVARVLGKLETNPVTVQLPRPGSTDMISGVVGRFALEFVTAKSLSGPEEFATLPALYASLDRGDLTGITRVMQGFARRPPPSPLSYVLDAASGASAQRQARIQAELPKSLLGRGLNFPHPEIGEVWGVEDLGPGFRRPVSCPVPALFITGDLDGNTPYDQAERVRAGFRNSVHLRIAGGGHASTMTVPDAAAAIADFLGGVDVTGRKLRAPAFRFR